MKLELDRFGQFKNYIHIGQAVVLFIAWAMTIAVFTRPGNSDGRVGWYFGLVRTISRGFEGRRSANDPVSAG